MLGPVGLGQDDDAARDRRLRAGRRRPGRAARRRRHRQRRRTSAPVNTVFQDYALFPHMSVLDNVAYGLRVKGVGQARAPRAGRARRCEMVRLPGVESAPPDPALGRPAPARRARARDRQPPARAAARRAARRARPEAAPGDADRAEVDPARAERADHLRLRHPRPGRGADDERPHRGLLGRAHRAGRDARARSTSVRPTSSWRASSAPRT